MKDPTRALWQVFSSEPFGRSATWALLTALVCAGCAGESDPPPSDDNTGQSRPAADGDSDTGSDIGDMRDEPASGSGAGDGVIPLSGLPQVPASFESVTLSAFGGIQDSLVPATDSDECDTRRHIDVFAFERTSGSLSWDFCRIGDRFEGTRALDSAEIATVLALYSNVTAAGESCGTDEPFGWFEPRSEGVTARFALSSMGCFNGFDAEAYVGDRGFFDLLAELERLAD